MIYSIEGNVGSGKSTLVEYLKSRGEEVKGKKLVFIEEPVAKWQEIGEGGKDIIGEVFFFVSDVGLYNAVGGDRCGCERKSG